MPLVSIITPCFNAERFITETLASVREQSLTSWELIVVDDGSTDRSAEIVSACARSDARIRLLRQANAGMCRARNVGYAASSPDARYLLFLDADDRILPEMLRRTASYLERHPHVGMVSCATECIDEQGALIPGENFAECVRYVPSRLGVRVLAPHIRRTPFAALFVHWSGVLASNTLIRRAAYAQTIGWDEAFGDPAEDRMLFLHIALQSQAHALADVLLHYRRYPGQMSSNGERISAQDRRLYEVWRPYASATPEHWRTWQQAQRFREGRYLPYRWALAGNAYLRQADPLHAGACYLRGVRQLGRYALDRWRPAGRLR